jgi:8-oxo-dGTP pyrophosphatase MutT (NUDIX family)
MSFANTFHETTQSGLSVCTNCGKSGHSFRQCQEPVSSYGVLVFRWIGPVKHWEPYKEFCLDTRNPTGITHLKPQVLMIQRKNSLGFMDIMRGKYKLSDPDYIRKQLHGMTAGERDQLLNDEFDQIWQTLWGPDTEHFNRYSHDRQTSKQKLLELRAGIEGPNGEMFTLADLLRQEPVVYETPEWEFPKGRRDPYETDIQCAYRELKEETGLDEEELWKLTNVHPFTETFYGSNNVHYRHTYYLAQYIGDHSISYDALNPEMAREIGNLKWMEIDEALAVLRPKSVEKKAILLQLASLLKNYVLLYRDTLSSLPVGENTSGEQQYGFTGRVITRGVSGRSERPGKPRRFFGERQTYRKVSGILNREETESRRSGETENGSRGESIRQRGGRRVVSGHQRRSLPLETSPKTRVSGESSDENNR